MDQQPAKPLEFIEYGFVFDPADAELVDRIVRIRDDVAALYEELRERPVMPGAGMMELMLTIQDWF